MKMNETNFAVLVSYVTSLNSLNHAMLYSDQVIALRDYVHQCMPQEVPSNRPVVSYSDVDELLCSMHQGVNKIDAIKAYRQITSTGLKEAKDAVERYWVAKPNNN